MTDIASNGKFAPLLKQSRNRSDQTHILGGSIWIIAGGLLSLLVLTFLASLTFGSVAIKFGEVLSYFTDFQSELLAHDIIHDLRLPRALNGALIGVHLALCGLILQSVLRNPLADPGVLGVSSGASLTIVVSFLAIDILLPSINFYDRATLPDISIPYIALVGGLLAAVIVLMLGWQQGIQPKRLILIGVVFGAFLNALVMAIVVGWGGGRSEIALLWLAGSLYGRGFDNLLPALPFTILCLAVLPILIPRLSLLRFGEDFAGSLGLYVHVTRAFALLIAVALAGSAVSIAGPVGFVGLITPHFARLLVGGDFRHLAWVTALSGAVLVMLADLLGRIVASPLEVPVGAVTSLIGVPVFIIIMQKFGWKLK